MKIAPKLLLAIAVLSSLLIISTSCNKDDDGDEVLARYNLVVNNNTDHNLDLYLKEGNDNFSFEGTLEESSSETILDLKVQTNYTLRVTLEGESVDDFNLEETFRNDDEMVTEYVIDINQ